MSLESQTTVPTRHRHFVSRLASDPDLPLVILLFVIALIPRMVLQLQAPLFRLPDTGSYLGPAVELYEGQGFSTPKRAGAYPLFLAVGFLVLGPGPGTVTALQHTLGIGIVMLTYLLGRTCFSRHVALAAGALVAMSGPQLTYERAPLPEPLFTLLLLGFTFTLVKATRSSRYGPQLATGVLLGLAALVKPVAQALLPVGIAFTALGPGMRWRRVWCAVILAAAFTMTVLPGALRNLAVYERFTTGGYIGINLLGRTLHHSCGVFVFDSPNLSPDPDPARQAARRIIQAAVPTCENPSVVLRRIRGELQVSELQANGLLEQITVEVIRRQPLDFFTEVLKSLFSLYPRRENRPASLWSSQWVSFDSDFRELAQGADQDQQGANAHSAALIDFYQPARYGYILPLLALFGAAAAFWRYREAWALVPATMIISFLLVHLAIVGPETRYRHAVEPLLNVLAAGGVWVAARYVGRHWRALRDVARTRLATTTKRQAPANTLDVS